MSTKLIYIETMNLFVTSCSVEALISAIRSHSLEVRHDHILETSRFVQKGLEALQICIELISCAENCRHRLTHWTRVKLASIYFNSVFANFCGLADVSLFNNSFTCKHYWWASDHIFTNFWKQMFFDFCE